jgi:dolichyl-phosphate beta-glucosyltransferase
MIDLSIILPAYNESRRLPACLSELSCWLSTTNLHYELIIVENGSTDGTRELVDGYAYHWSNIVTCHLPMAGKGAAVRYGMLEARGDWRLMCDVDLSMSAEQIGRLMARRFDGDVVIASRHTTGAIRIGEPLIRRVMSRVFRWMAWAILPGIHDSQCGFKLFSARAALDIFALQSIPGMAFDVEVLRIATLLGYRVVEVPIVWRHDPDSRVHPVRDSLQMARDLLAIRRNEQAGLYNLYSVFSSNALG